jgi:uncharacterized protein YciI
MEGQNMVVIISKYIKSLEVIDALVVEHRKFLDDCYKKSLFVCSGPQIPRVGGLLMARVDTVEEAREIMKDDPFTIHEAAEYQYVKFSPTKYDDRFSCFVKAVRQ